VESQPLKARFASLSFLPEVEREYSRTNDVLELKWSLEISPDFR
jgi:hypothetical protein